MPTVVAKSVKKKVTKRVVKKKEAIDDAVDKVMVEESAETVDDVERIINSYIKKVKNPLTAIRAFCVMCMGAQVKSVTKCTSDCGSKVPCPLWPFRMGKNTMDSRYGVYKEFPSKKKAAKKKVATKKRK